MSDDATLAFYDANAADYAPWSSDGSPRGWLRKFIAMLPAGGAALDLGCGAGWAAAEMRDAGLSVTAIDASAGLAAEARRLHGIEVEIRGFETLDDAAAYDGVWASFSLLHRPKAEMPDHLRRIFTALRPGGALYLGLKGGDAGETVDRLGRFYAHWPQEEIVLELTRAGFENVDIREYPAEAGYDGSAAPLLHGTARRPA